MTGEEDWDEKKGATWMTGRAGIQEFYQVGENKSYVKTHHFYVFEFAVRSLLL
ncbi:hypothetical protein HET73_01330 [Wolbachia endosymbiont of Atemnus politus]|uniref:hypothetical protein n=1 Tax=Wolbachia endosymbiont of Atemnus politus TaxID=2682840 RepID=UPI001573A074|nr:hypothetical protein [Wolbachia endosymbiont of Atemnus politus]NSM56282.1 hypothetical protein [Wolbachia endosymbiont of Atemnus politus]NSX83581.1 hypothetical protein [Wolbachia endosymbiont of Atemnus politus]